MHDACPFFAEKCIKTTQYEKPMNWITALQLPHWANSLQGPPKFSALVENLVHAPVAAADAFRFKSEIFGDIEL
jgi:hypothetical protein